MHAVAAHQRRQDERVIDGEATTLTHFATPIGQGRQEQRVHPAPPHHGRHHEGADPAFVVVITPA